MIKAKDAIRIARSLIGTPYSEMDCINLIKAVIRKAPGGDPKYTTAGTNSLWDSHDMSGRYRDLTWRSYGTENPKAGMLAFKSEGEDVHHVGLVTEEGTVIHSSSAQGGRGVVETALDYTWDKIAIHRMIGTAEGTAGTEESGDDMEGYKAIVNLANPKSYLNVRNAPGTGSERIGKIYDGQVVTVQAEAQGDWVFITYDGGSGYVDGLYLTRVEHEEENVIRVMGKTVIIDSEGNEFVPAGVWHVELRAED